MNWFRRQWYHHKYRDSAYEGLFKPPNQDELVSLDCETTSLDPNSAELVTIAATKIRDNVILTSESLNITLRAPDSLCGRSIAIHHLRHQDLDDGISETEAIQSLVDFIGNRPLVGYHIRYDKTILDRYAQRIMGFPLPNTLVEVSHIYQRRLERMLPSAYYDISMEAISRHLGLPRPERHDALEDAITAALIYVRLKYGDVPMLKSA